MFLFLITIVTKRLVCKIARLQIETWLTRNKRLFCALWRTAGWYTSRLEEASCRPAATRAVGEILKTIQRYLHTCKYRTIELFGLRRSICCPIL